MILDFIRRNKRAFQFLLIFLGLYSVLNIIYYLFIRHYYPTSDPFTRSVCAQVVWFLSFFDSSVTMYPSQFKQYIAIANDRQNMIYFLEGYNGFKAINVYLSFIIAFAWNRKLFIQFALFGVLGIHLLNLTRVSILYGVAFSFPEKVSFFEKYLSPSIIYIFVFVMWYLWVRSVRNSKYSLKQREE